MLRKFILFLCIVFLISVDCFWFSSKSEEKTMSTPNQPKTNNQIDVAATVQLAIENHKNGNVEQALLNYELALPLMASSNTKASLHGNAGALHLQLGNNEKAREHFQASVDINPKNSQAHFNLAVLLTSKLNEHAKAIKHCKLAIYFDAKNYKAYHLMGNILQTIGKPTEAEEYFLTAEAIALELQQPTPTQKDSTSGDGNVDLSRWDKNHLLQMNVGQELTISSTSSSSDGVSIEYTVKCVSTSPFIFTIDNFISGAECDAIMIKASDKLEKSFVMGGVVEYTGTTTDATTSGSDSSNSSKNNVDGDSSSAVNEGDAYRSSYTAWLTKDTLLSSIQQKLSDIIGLPVSYIIQQSEDLQVVHYHGIATEGGTPATSSTSNKHGGQFKVHHDSSAFHSRYLTALIYLNDVTSSEDTIEMSGGETWFPFGGENGLSDDSATTSNQQAILSALNHYDAVINSDANNVRVHEKLSGVLVRPKKGSIVVFFNHLPTSGDLDPFAVHAGLPVRRSTATCDAQSTGNTGSDDRVGDKWVANYWIKLDKTLLSKS